MEKRHPAVAHSAPARLLAIVAEEIAGAWDRLGGVGAQLANMAGFLEVALRADEETAAKLAEKQNRK